MEQLYLCFGKFDKFVSFVKYCHLLRTEKGVVPPSLAVCVSMMSEIWPMYLGNCFKQEMGMLVNSLCNGLMSLHMLFVEYCQLIFD